MIPASEQDSECTRPVSGCCKEYVADGGMDYTHFKSEMDVGTACDGWPGKRIHLDRGNGCNNPAGWAREKGAVNRLQPVIAFNIPVHG